MDNRQSKPTGPAPSEARVWYDAVWFVIVAAVTLWVAWGAETNREFVGAALGILLALMQGLQAFGGWVKRSEAAMAARREALTQTLPQSDREVIESWERRRRLHKPGPY